MIFVSVGTQLGFDRMIKIVDETASRVHQKIVAQIGDSELTPKNIEYQKFFTPIETNQAYDACSVIVAHAGMGTILSALQRQKPIVIFPRRLELGEHRNNHQLATANKFAGRNGVYVAYEESMLVELLLSADKLTSGQQLSPVAPPEFIKNLRKIIF